ncbi:MAG: SGNH/GDSL hydrolase family protein [Deltaproteobacteria bacterium]|nr:SGNH/GDSL hydrolase family protein [Deltaproteobacteria bacterium]
MKPVCAALIFLLVTGSSNLLKAETNPSPFPIPARNNTIVFLGDSITWQNLYTAYVENYFLRHYPEKNLRFVNLGVRGDTAAGAIRRLDRDLLPLKPDLVLIMLGMNDGGYRGKNHFLLQYYLVFLEKLVEIILEKTNARIILITSTCVAPADYKLSRYNPMLAAMAAQVIKLGQNRTIPVIDLFTHFSKTIQAAKLRKPVVNLMLDPVHPGPAGHLVIARFLLGFLDTGRDRPAIKSSFDLKNTKWPAGKTSIQLTHNHKNIYFSDRARQALQALEVQNRFNQHLVIIKGLSKRVRIRVDGYELGVFTPEQLAKGVDLNRLGQAPWVKQAKRLHDLLQQKWRLNYYLWDPRELGRDALIQVSPPGIRRPVITKDQAYRQLENVIEQLSDFQKIKPKTYTLELLLLK